MVGREGAEGGKRLEARAKKTQRAGRFARASPFLHTTASTRGKGAGARPASSRARPASAALTQVLLLPPLQCCCSSLRPHSWTRPPSSLAHSCTPTPSRALALTELLVKLEELEQEESSRCILAGRSREGGGLACPRPGLCPVRGSSTAGEAARGRWFAGIPGEGRCSKAGVLLVAQRVEQVRMDSCCVWRCVVERALCDCCDCSFCCLPLDVRVFVPSVGGLRHTGGSPSRCIPPPLLSPPSSPQPTNVRQPRSPAPRGLLRAGSPRSWERRRHIPP